MSLLHQRNDAASTTIVLPPEVVSSRPWSPSTEVNSISRSLPVGRCVCTTPCTCVRRVPGRRAGGGSCLPSRSAVMGGGSSVSLSRCDVMQRLADGRWGITGWRAGGSVRRVSVSICISRTDDGDVIPSSSAAAVLPTTERRFALQFLIYARDPLDVGWATQ